MLCDFYSGHLFHLLFIVYLPMLILKRREFMNNTEYNSWIYLGSLLLVNMEFFSFVWWLNLAITPLLLLIIGTFYRIFFYKRIHGFFKNLKNFAKNRFKKIQNGRDGKQGE